MSVMNKKHIPYWFLSGLSFVLFEATFWLGPDLAEFLIESVFNIKFFISDFIILYHIVMLPLTGCLFGGVILFAAKEIAYRLTVEKNND